MKKKLTLSLEEGVIKQAKLIALENNMSVSEIMELITIAVSDDKNLLNELKDKHINV